VAGENDLLTSVSLSSEHEPLGDKVAERKVKDVLWLAAPLALESLLRFFSRHGRPILAHKPLRILSNRVGDQVLSESAPKGTSIPKWLEKKISYVFDTRTFYPEDGDPFLIVVCDVRTTNVLLAIPSLRVIIEIKFVLNGEQTDFANVIEGVAADTSLYLSERTGFSQIVAFVWDNSRCSEQHNELLQGLRRIRGIKDAVVVSRPGGWA